MFGTEALVNLGLDDIKKLEAKDEDLLRSILDSGRNTTKLLLYSELGVTPIRFLVSMRRLLYYHYIKNLDDKSTLKNMIELTEQYPTTGDWASCVQENFKTLNILDSNQFL